MSNLSPIRKGLFISFEGIDGAGKTTHVEALVEAFRKAGRTVVQTREPGGTPLAEELRALVLHRDMDPVAEALLVFAARRNHVLEVIGPALARGDVVISDRFADASFAYQGGGRGVDWAFLQRLEAEVVRFPGQPDAQPDLTLWFDLPSAMAAQRLAGTRAPDRFEAETSAFFDRVAQAYRRRAQECAVRFVRIDATRAPHDVWEQVHAGLRARGWLA
ncbi:MAG: dTMP kinase [Brachymonas sp.]